MVGDPSGRANRSVSASTRDPTPKTRLRCTCLRNAAFDLPGSDRWNLASTTFPDAGPMVRIRFPPPRSLSHRCFPWLQAQRPRVRRECEPGRDQRTGPAGDELARPGRFSLTGIDAVPPGRSQRSTRRAQAWAWAHLVERRSSAARQQAALIGPVERQIEFGKTRRSEFDGLPAVQDRLDQLRAQKGEVDEAPDIATGDAVALGQFPQRSRASGGKLFEPRASAGDRLDQRGVAFRSVVL